MHESAADQRMRVVRIEARRLAEVSDRAIVVALLSVDGAAVSQSRCELRVHPECFAIILERAVVVTFGGVRVASVIEGEEDVRMREVAALDRPSIELDGPIEIATLDAS